MDRNQLIKIVKISLYVILIGLVAFYLVFLYGVFSSPIKLSVAYQTIKFDINKYPRRLDGVFVIDENKTNLWPISVMIDNMIDARPSWGLSRANLVIESLAEANITRFLVFYASDESVEKIGPVRSARPYFAEWAEELNAVYAHSGGSPEALKNIKNGKYDIFDLNEFFNGGYFWRDWQRLAPHNLFTSIAYLKQFLKTQPIESEPAYPVWSFKNDAPASKRGAPAEKIKIVYKDPDYLVEWQYDPSQNDYSRYQSGSQHLDADGSEIRAKNIVIQNVKMSILDDIGRKNIPTFSSGTAVIFQDGQIIQGKWEKFSQGDRTKFFDEIGNEIKFNRGATWIEIVAKGCEVKY